MATVLIIEDDTLTAGLLHTLIQSIGHVSLNAYTSQEGLALAQAHNPDLVLVDLRLPGITGWEVVRVLRQNPVMAHTPIIAVSVEVESGDRIKALASGCNDFVAKPFNVQYLRDLILHYLED